MSLSTNVSNLATRVATEAKALRTLINGNAADLSALTTTQKGSLVAAINEIEAALSTAGVAIDDTTASSTTVYSSTKTDNQIAAAVSALVAGAPELLDTLNELAAALNDDPNFATTITNQIATKADDNAVVKLTGNQTISGVKTFSDAPAVPDAAFAIAKVSGLQTALDAKANGADVGDTTTNFVTTFEAGLA
jgi:hypothetical protein